MDYKTSNRVARIVAIGFIAFIAFAFIAPKKNPVMGMFCPNRGVECFVKLYKGEVSPYRSNKAPYDGYHWAGYASAEACWAGIPKLCEPCTPISPERATRDCQRLYPRHQVQAGSVKDFQ